MKLRTFLSLVLTGQIRVIRALSKSARHFHRIAFLGGGLSSGLLRRLADGPVPFETLVAELQVAPEMRDALRAWLELGVDLKELRSLPAGYTLRGGLARRLVDPRHDAAAAFVEEMVHLHHTLISQSVERLRRNEPLTLADQDARLIARSSRIVEPLICEALAELVPPKGAFRLLEIGCGSAAYIRYATSRNPELRAVGLELQPEAAALAAENVARWNLADQVTIEIGDVRQRHDAAQYDLVTLHQNIYYFPVATRVGLLRHIRAFLKPGGRLLLTTVGQGRGSSAAVLDLWGSLTADCGRLPAPPEMIHQLREAGFTRVSATNLVPTESFYAFKATNPD